jgi:hypothetical protein
MSLIDVNVESVVNAQFPPGTVGGLWSVVVTDPASNHVASKTGADLPVIFDVPTELPFGTFTFILQRLDSNGKNLGNPASSVKTIASTAQVTIQVAAAITVTSEDPAVAVTWLALITVTVLTFDKNFVAANPGKWHIYAINLNGGTLEDSALSDIPTAQLNVSDGQYFIYGQRLDVMGRPLYQHAVNKITVKTNVA